MGPYPGPDGEAASAPSPAGSARRTRSRSSAAWPRRAVLGTLGTAGAGVAMVAFAAAAFANAPNPVHVEGSLSAPNGANAPVTVTVSGSWSWEAPYSPSPQTNCDGRYGAGWSVDWWGINKTPQPINGLSYQVAATSGGQVATNSSGQPFLTTSTAPSPAVTLTSKSGTTFHASQTINGWITPLCTNGHPAGNFSSTATYPNQASVPDKICVNFYDLHGSPGQPKLNDFFSTNGDNSIKTNAFDPATVDGNCVVPIPQNPSIGVVKTNNAGGNPFAHSNTASSLSEQVTFKVEISNTTSVPVTVDSVTDAVPTGNTPGAVNCVDTATGLSAVNESIAAGGKLTCTFAIPNYLANNLPAGASQVEDQVVVNVHTSSGTTGSGHDESIVKAPAKASLGANIRLCQGDVGPVGHPVRGADPIDGS
jgi:hypothetical protein